MTDPKTTNENEVLAAADALDPGDSSERAQYLREVAGSIRDHRESAARNQR